jgi:predicted nucleotidyltransferase
LPSQIQAPLPKLTVGILPSLGSQLPLLGPELSGKPILDQAAEVFQPLSVPALEKTSGETSAQLSGTPFDGVAPVEKTFGDVLGGEGAGTPNLAPGSGGKARRSRPEPETYRSWPKSKAATSRADRLQYYKIYATALHWYTVTHIKSLWPAYVRKRQDLVLEGKKPSVSTPRSFFAGMRVMGQSGPYYVLGFGNLNDEDVIAEASQTFNRHFDAGAAERQAFDRFVARAKEYNKLRRAGTFMRKHVRDALLTASLLPREELAAHFDSLLQDDKAKETADYQLRGEGRGTLEAFRKVIHQAVSEEAAGARDRVLGVILLGSFANGSPGPTSDFDLQVITADGGSGRTKAFVKKVIENWGAQRQRKNPITFHEASYPPSKSLLDRVHDGPYRVITPLAGLEEALARKRGERPTWVMQRELTLHGRLLRSLQYAVVYGVTLWASQKMVLEEAIDDLKDRWAYNRIYLTALHWYTVTHIKTMWPNYLKKRAQTEAAGKKPSVDEPRRFFSWMRAMGQSGPYYVLGFAARPDEEVIAEAKETFEFYFKPDPAEKAAFERFTERAREYNKAKRAPVNLLKNIRDPMLAASHKPREELAAYFDSLLLDDKAKAVEDYQKSGQATATMKAFREAMKIAVAEQDSAAPDRVVAVLLLGSFVNGSAHPSSDFDVQVITANGGSARVQPFIKRALEIWGAERQAVNPITFHDAAYRPSKSLLMRVHDGPYQVISPDHRVLAPRLERRVGEPVLWSRRRELTWAGRFERFLQQAVVYAVTLWADFKTPR